ncbi:hypothetical protein DSO57_1017306 [Entomophthora muscae]|uniref:Uncharacterized protein n=1 Tax=Entomophthora muscae TaxID=34485 RepID=A0ACC2RJ97_9FUNG|nr:hypothetical protein DSO57_1017306 [Entomophthora muscae]
MKYTFSISAFTLSLVAGSAIPIDASICTKVSCHLPPPTAAVKDAGSGSNFIFSRSKQEYASNIGYTAFTASYGSPAMDDFYEGIKETSSEEKNIEYYPADYDTTDEYYTSQDNLEYSTEDNYPADYDVIDDTPQGPDGTEPLPTEEATSQEEASSEMTEIQPTFSPENYDITNHGYTPQVIYDQGQESAPEQAYVKLSTDDGAPLMSNSQKQTEEVSAVGKAYFCKRKPRRNTRKRSGNILD